uniref:Cytochrome P450 family protein n=1 Tax=Oryza sativa subsp. japonica TaxID=39947 RepID=C8C9S7_ORYSJ|nr:cytochrome P450 family protein [Oryza sativa Japonica Group]
MENSQVWLLWGALSVALFFYFSTLRRRYAGGKPLPPGPTPLPLIGNLHLVGGGTFHHKLRDLARVHGPVMTLKLGLATNVVISSREAAIEAYTKYDRHLAARATPDTFRACGFADRSMVFIPSSDPQWKALRGIHASHVFTPRVLAAVRPIRERKVGDLIAYLRAHAGEEVLVGHAMYTGILNMVSFSYFSVDIVDMGSQMARELREVVDDIILVVGKPNVSDFYPFLRPLDLQGLRRWTTKRFNRVFSIMGDIIDRRLAHIRDNKPRHDDILDSILELMAAGKIDRVNVLNMLFEAFVAGADTMALTLEWVMAELLKNPSVMAKARAELRDVLGDKEIVEEADAARLPYLQAVLKEAMRLHPVGALLLPHFAMEDGVEVGGYAVPKGSTVLFNAWAIMRDAAAWERPDEFVPERFVERTPQLDFRGKDVEFMPFGSGRRLCPGLPLAERVVPFILASMLHTFEWKLPGGMTAEDVDVSEKFKSANVLAVPLKAVPVLIK